MHASDVSRGRQILRRFLALAEERLDYLTELYQTGRWERYFTQAELLDNVRDAKKAVAAWSLLVSTEALPNNRAVDLSWLDSPRPLPMRRPVMLDVEMPSLSPRFTERAAAPQAIASDVLPPPPEPIRIDVPMAAASPVPQTLAVPPTMPPWQDALDCALMAQRYPLLRQSA